VRGLFLTSEGRFEAAEQKNGPFVERDMLRTERGLREIVNGKIVRLTQDAVERSRSTGFELNDQEDLSGWGGPLLRWESSRFF